MDDKKTRMAKGNLYKYSSEFTCKVQFIKRVGQSFYILGRFIFYPKHFSISTVGQSPL
jgi:hypothetical protein